MPRRIQRRRTKGWRMPEGAVYVGRPSAWANPWRVVWEPGYLRRGRSGAWAVAEPAWVPGGSSLTYCSSRAVAHRYARWRFRRWLQSPFAKLDLEPVRGRDLACWCPLDAPCHADVLLELANR